MAANTGTGFVFSLLQYFVTYTIMGGWMREFLNNLYHIVWNVANVHQIDAMRLTETRQT